MTDTLNEPDLRASQYTAFAGTRRVGRGSALEVARVARKIEAEGSAVLIFDDAQGRQVDFDLSGSDEELRRRLEAGPAETDGPRKPGRPKLGVVAREVTLLPRHWEWLNAQRGGASVALRRLVEEARRTHARDDRRQRAREATYRVLGALAGNAPGFEEALRALFAGEGVRFFEHLAGWPEDVRQYAREMAAEAFEPADGRAGRQG